MRRAVRQDDGLDSLTGMYLFPGEEVMFSEQEPWYRLKWHQVSEREFCPAWKDVISQVGFLICDSTCPRERRPLACRLFPLAAVITRSGHSTSVDVMLDPDARLMCPLARQETLDALNKQFIEACKQAYMILASDPAILADLTWLQEQRHTNTRTNERSS